MLCIKLAINFAPTRFINKIINGDLKIIKKNKDIKQTDLYDFVLNSVWVWVLLQISLAQTFNADIMWSLDQIGTFGK